MEQVEHQVAKLETGVSSGTKKETYYGRVLKKLGQASASLIFTINLIITITSIIMIKSSSSSIAAICSTRKGICLRKQRWFWPQACSVFFSHSPLSLAISSLMTRQPEDQGKGKQRRGGKSLQGIKIDNIDQSFLRAIMSVRKAIHYVGQQC